MAARTTNTLSELIQRMLSDIAQAKAVLPESDVPKLYAIEDVLLQITRQPIQQMQDQGMLPGNGQGQPQGQPDPGQLQQMMQQMQQMGGGGGPMQGAGGPGGPMPQGGPVMSAPAPNPDELRRMMSASQ